MTDTQKFILILWAHHFDEITAAISVTELRRLDWTVRVVGLTGRRNRGWGGLDILPDMMLESSRKLLNDTAAIIVPCENSSWQILHRDPRLVEFLADLGQSRIPLLVSSTVENTAEIQAATAPILTYPGPAELAKFLHRTFELPGMERL